eukprot:2725533-Heterocapsa_arctica.AAC.1
MHPRRGGPSITHSLDDRSSDSKRRSLGHAPELVHQGIRDNHGISKFEQPLKSGPKLHSDLVNAIFPPEGSIHNLLNRLRLITSNSSSNPSNW